MIGYMDQSWRTTVGCLAFVQVGGYLIVPSTFLSGRVRLLIPKVARYDAILNCYNFKTGLLK